MTINKAWVLGVCLLVRPCLAAEAPFYRVVYSDDEGLEMGQEWLERAYGAHIVVIPPSGHPPGRPLSVDGRVLHTDSTEDLAWVRGSYGKDPMIVQAEIEREIQRELGLDDISDKWDEYRFLSAVAPALKPPEMLLGSHLEPLVDDGGLETEIRTRVRSLTGVECDAAMMSDLVQLELRRRLIVARLGKSILKSRERCHSEGRLPKTSDDWVSLYVNYIRSTKSEVERLSREKAGGGTYVEEFLIDLPYLEGRVLEDLLRKPESVVIQKMVFIDKEVRIHIVEGEVLKGATFLRHFHFGEYLSAEEVQRIETAVRQELLGRLPERWKSFSASADVVIEKESGHLTIIDLNAGLESGYFFPQEDLFTTNLVSEHFSGVRPPFLKEFDEFLRAPPGARKIELLRGIEERYAFYFESDDPAFWDPVLRHYRELLGSSPDADRFAAVLEELYQEGLRSSRLYWQLIREVQDRRRGNLWRPDTLERWARELERMDPSFRSRAEGNILTCEPQSAGREPKSQKTQSQGVENRNGGVPGSLNPCAQALASLRAA